MNWTQKRVQYTGSNNLPTSDLPEQRQKTFVRKQLSNLKLIFLKRKVLQQQKKIFSQERAKIIK